MDYRARDVIHRGVVEGLPCVDIYQKIWDADRRVPYVEVLAEYTRVKNLLEEIAK